MIASPVCAPNVVANAAFAPIASPTTIAASLSSPTPPSASGTSVAEQPERAGTRRSAAARPPSLFCSSSRHRRDDLVGDELGGRLRDQPVLVAESFWREDRVRRRVAREPRAADRGHEDMVIGARSSLTSNSPEQIFERLADFARLPFEQMRGAVDHDEFLRLLELRVERPEILQRTELVEVALDEELGFGAVERVREIVVGALTGGAMPMSTETRGSTAPVSSAIQEPNENPAAQSGTPDSGPP